MLMDQSSAELIEMVRQGDPQAEAELHRRYVGRLIDLARTKISAKMKSRFDAEDVVQSVYRSFFINLRDGRYEFRFSGALWSLLAAITINKVRKNVRHHSAEKRSVNREQNFSLNDSMLGIAAEEIAREPTADEVNALVDELTIVLDGLPEVHRMILQCRLQENSIEAVARQADCSERTVHRALTRIRQRLHERLVEHTKL